METNDALRHIQIEKTIIEDMIKFPEQNEYILLNATSRGNINQKYLIDINRKRAILSRCTFQKRIHNSIPLVRLDIGNKPHKNPDGEVLEGNHIHIYKEGYNLAWAYPLNHKFINQINPSFDISLLNDLSMHGTTFVNFCSFCNITKIPLFQITTI